MNMPSTAKPSKRQSCDRCHAQKLRCSRQGNGAGERCTRCFRQNAECKYSVSLPKGRPSTQKANAAAAANTSNGSSNSRGNGLNIQFPAGAMKNTSHISNASSATSHPTPDTPPSSMLDFERERSQFSGMSTPDTASISWEREHGLLTGQFPLMSPGGVTDIVGDAWPWDSDPYFWPDWVGNDLSASGRPLPPQRTNTNNSSLSTSLAANACLDFDIAASITSSVSLSNLNVHSSPSLSRTTSGLDPSPPNTQACITHLSDLLSHLSTAFASAQQELAQLNGRSLVANTAFDSLVTLLVNPSTAQVNTGISCAVKDTFSGSQRLLEILSHLQQFQCVEDGSDSDYQADLPSSLRLSHQMPPSPNEGSYPHRRQNSEPVLHHLVLACHNLLLNLFGPLLAALQNDADSIASTSNAEDLSPSMVDMRLVLLVQLSSFFIDRLHKSVNTYLCQQKGPDLEAEIQQRLMHLRRTLQI